jgi:hypothetical protein
LLAVFGLYWAAGAALVARDIANVDVSLSPFGQRVFELGMLFFVPIEIVLLFCGARALGLKSDRNSGSRLLGIGFMLLIGYALIADAALWQNSPWRTSVPAVLPPSRFVHLYLVQLREGRFFPH